MCAGITIESVSLTHSEHCVFKNLTMQFQEGLWHSVLGRSGVGKTSLLRLIAGLQEPDSGSIRSPNTSSLRSQVAYVPQEDSLLPWLSIIENVQLGPRLRGEASSDTHKRAIKLLTQVGLYEWRDRLPAMLSGGMRQRAALARTLLENPPVVLMDEPFSRLDAITRHELQSASFELLRGRTVILVTHDPAEALRLSHKVHVLQPGIPSRCPLIELQATPIRGVENPTLAQHLPTLWQLLDVQNSDACVEYSSL